MAEKELTRGQQVCIERAFKVAEKQISQAAELLEIMGGSGDEKVDAQLQVAFAQILATNYLAEVTKRGG
jgi:copper homeostasis protein CutC